MKIEVNKERFEKLLAMSGSIVPKNPVIPITSEFLFSFNEERINITSCDLESEIVTGINYVLLEGKVIDFVADGKVIYQTLKYLKTEVFVMELVSENKKQKLVFGEPSKKKVYEIPIIHQPNDFPLMKNEFLDPIVLDGEFLSKAVKTASSICNKNLLNPASTGFWIRKEDDKIQIFSTSGQMAFLFEKKMQIDYDLSICVSTSVSEPIQNYINSPEVKISVDVKGNNVKFEDGALTICSRCIEAVYPQVKDITKQKDENVFISIPRLDFSLGVNRCKLFADQDSSSIEIDFIENDLKIESENTKFKKIASEVQSITSKSPEINFKTYYSADLLLQSISPLDGENLVLHQKNEKSTVFISDDKDRSYSVLSFFMPIRKMN